MFLRFTHGSLDTAHAPPVCGTRPAATKRHRPARAGLSVQAWVSADRAAYSSSPATLAFLGAGALK